jgi:hypothetical protein
MGGGARTAYQAGALQALSTLLPNPQRFPFDILVGTSAGALNASFLAGQAQHGAQAFEQLAQFWTHIRSQAVYRLPHTPLSRFSRWATALGVTLTARKQGAALDNMPLVDTLHHAIDLTGIDEALNSADLRAGSTHAGANIDNVIRQNLRKLLTDKRLVRNNTFSQAERNMMERFVRGGSGQNLLRWVGRLSPESGQVGTYLGIGSAASIPGGWMLPAAGFVSKRVSDALTRRNGQILSETIRRGGPAVKPTLSAGERAAQVAEEIKRRAAIAGSSAGQVPALIQPQNSLSKYQPEKR